MVRHADVILNGGGEYEPFALMNGSGFGRAKTISSDDNPPPCAYAHDELPRA